MADFAKAVEVILQREKVAYRARILYCALQLVQFLCETGVLLAVGYRVTS